MQYMKNMMDWQKKNESLKFFVMDITIFADI